MATEEIASSKKCISTKKPVHNFSKTHNFKLTRYWLSTVFVWWKSFNLKLCRCFKTWIWNFFNHSRLVIYFRTILKCGSIPRRDCLLTCSNHYELRKMKQFCPTITVVLAKIPTLTFLILFKPSARDISWKFRENLLLPSEDIAVTAMPLFVSCLDV